MSGLAALRSDPVDVARLHGNIGLQPAAAPPIAHRLPWLTVHWSLDGGRTWQGTIIDNGGWSMGSMCEVEPDVVLHCYWDAYESLMRVQLIQVTPSGIEPVRVR